MSRPGQLTASFPDPVRVTEVPVTRAELLAKTHLAIISAEGLNPFTRLLLVGFGI